MAIATLLHTPLTLGIRGVATAFLAGGVEPSIKLASSAGRAYATAPWNRRRLARAEEHLRVAFPSWPEQRIREHAVLSYEHIFRLAVEITHAPRLFTEEGWLEHIKLAPIAPAVRALVSGKPCLMITGHIGNWEIVGYTIALLGFPMHALYRPIDLVPLDRWVRQVRERRGLVLVDKFGALKVLPQVMGKAGTLGIVGDQNGGDRGVFVPFFNRLTSTYKSVGLLAQQYGATIICGCARRLGSPTLGPLASPAASDELRSMLELPPGADTNSLSSSPAASSSTYQIELSDVFGPEDWSQHPDPMFYLTARYRLAIETMIRRSPSQYDWMHRVWRSRPKHERQNKPFPDSIREKTKLLPWIRSEDLDQIETHSRRDAETLARTGKQKLS